MFDTGKKITQLRDEIREMDNRLQKISRTEDEIWKHADEAVSRVEQQIEKHDMAIEDLLDSLEEWGNDQREETEKLRAALENEQGKAQKEAERREAALLKLGMSCLDQFFVLRKAAGKSGSEQWIRQIDLMMELLREPLIQAGLQTLGNVGELFSYQIHDAAGTEAAKTPDQDMRVAGILSQGYAYQGRVLRKAKVSVYRYPEGTN